MASEFSAAPYVQRSAVVRQPTAASQAAARARAQPVSDVQKLATVKKHVACNIKLLFRRVTFISRSLQRVNTLDGIMTNKHAVRALIRAKEILFAYPTADEYQAPPESFGRDEEPKVVQFRRSVHRCAWEVSSRLKAVVRYLMFLRDLTKVIALGLSIKETAQILNFSEEMVVPDEVVVIRHSAMPVVIHDSLGTAQNARPQLVGGTAIQRAEPSTLQHPRLLHTQTSSSPVPSSDSINSIPELSSDESYSSESDSDESYSTDSDFEEESPVATPGVVPPSLEQVQKMLSSAKMEHDRAEAQFTRELVEQTSKIESTPVVAAARPLPVPKATAEPQIAQATPVRAFTSTVPATRVVTHTQHAGAPVVAGGVQPVRRDGSAQPTVKPERILPTPVPAESVRRVTAGSRNPDGTLNLPGLSAPAPLATLAAQDTPERKAPASLVTNASVDMFDGLESLADELEAELADLGRVVAEAKQLNQQETDAHIAAHGIEDESALLEETPRGELLGTDLASPVVPSSDAGAVSSEGSSAAEGRPPSRSRSSKKSSSKEKDGGSSASTRPKKRSSRSKHASSSTGKSRSSSSKQRKPRRKRPSSKSDRKTSQVDRDLDAIAQMADMLVIEDQRTASGNLDHGTAQLPHSAQSTSPSLVARSPSSDDQEMFKAFDVVMSSKISTLSRNQGELLNRLMEGASDSFAPQAPRGKVRTKKNCPVPGTLRVHKKGPLLLKKSGALSSSWKKSYFVLDAEALHCVSNEEDWSTIRGQWMLEEFESISWSHTQSGQPLCILILLKDGKNIVLSSENDTDMAHWIIVISAVKYYLVSAALSRQSRKGYLGLAKSLIEDVSDRRALFDQVYKTPFRGGIIKCGIANYEWSYAPNGILKTERGIKPALRFAWSGEELKPQPGEVDTSELGRGLWDGKFLRWVMDNKPEKSFTFVYNEVDREYEALEAATIGKTWAWSRHFLVNKDGDGEWIMEGDVPEPIVMFVNLITYLRTT